MAGLGSDELEEYPEILPGEEPHVYVDLTDRPLLEAIDSAFAMIRASLGLPMGPRNINLYGAKKTRRRRAMERLFDLARRVRR